MRWVLGFRVQVIVAFVLMFKLACAGQVNTGATSVQDTKTVDATSGRVTTNDSDPYLLPPGEDPDNHLLLPLLKHMVGDQEQFWTSPTRFKVKDLKWAIPFAGITAGFLASDQWWSKQIPNSPSQLKRSLNFSDYSVYSMIGIGGGAFLLGHVRHDDHMEEAGLLSGEAAINSTGVAYLFKEITQRQRPLEGNGNGNFFSGGASFPSEHSAVAWSIASVMAHEYPGTLTQIAAYGLASAVTITRVTARQHFPSDVIVGSALGWYFGRQAYRAHHDPEVGGGPWGAWPGEGIEAPSRNPENMASPYVPLDSWIYPALERLIAMGLVQSANLDIRPWTRMACAGMVEEAGDQIPDSDRTDQGAVLYRSLAEEFDPEIRRLDGDRNFELKVDSAYVRGTTISGQALRDGYHFGQTLVNDFGRPYGDGTNFISGLSGCGVAGPLAFYVRGEYEYAPSVMSLSTSTLKAMANADFLSDFGPNYMPPGYGSSFNTGSYSRFTLLEGYASLAFHNVQFSFGKQSAWLGPGESSSLLFSNNAAPIPMFKIDDVKPYEIPLISKLLGPVHSEFFLGQLSGATFVYQPPTLYGPNNISPQPFVHGDKISFKPTANLEFGMGIVAMFGGPGVPFTFKEFFRTYYAHNSNLATNPGKRFSAADITYRLPGARKWLTAYLDSLVVDEYSPIGSSRASFNAGLYMPQVPKIPKLELRAEGLNTDHPNGACCNPGFVYFDLRYISGFTNNGSLLGSWIGRAGWGGQGWATYNFSPRTMIQAGYREQRVDHDFIGGGDLNDISLRGNYTWHRDLTVAASLQYEHWNFPVLSTSAQSNFTTSFQLTYWPRWSLK
jgi:membrane-associated phospholipid phosphatase